MINGRSSGLVLILALIQGFLSMGFQLVASRLLAPHFGTTIIVWAFLISSFLAAFSAGSFAGGAISKLDERRQAAAVTALAFAGVGSFAVVAFAGRSILRVIEPSFEDAWAGIGVACAILFFVPVTTLSALLPIYAELLGRGDRGVGVSSGLVYGTSTLGNITGVMVTAFALIPNFPTFELLVGWLAVAVASFAAAVVAVGRRGSSRDF